MARAGLAGVRVLVVEDDYLVAMDLEATLLVFGCTVVAHASRLDAAVQMARRESIDLAVLDVKLDGDLVYPVAQALADRGVPFVFMTGYDTGLLPDAWKATPCLPKPVDRAALQEQLHRLVRRP